MECIFLIVKFISNKGKCIQFVLYRIDIDRKPAYTTLDILNWEIEMPNVGCWFWDSDNLESYANPLLINLTKSAWNLYPNFLFIGKWFLNEKFSQIHISLTKSDIVPKLYTYPMILYEVFIKQFKEREY